MSTLEPAAPIPSTHAVESAQGSQIHPKPPKEKRVRFNEVNHFYIHTLNGKHFRYILSDLSDIFFEFRTKNFLVSNEKYYFFLIFFCRQVDSIRFFENNLSDTDDDVESEMVSQKS